MTSHFGSQMLKKWANLPVEDIISMRTGHSPLKLGPKQRPLAGCLQWVQRPEPLPPSPARPPDSESGGGRECAHRDAPHGAERSRTSCAKFHGGQAEATHLNSGKVAECPPTIRRGCACLTQSKDKQRQKSATWLCLQILRYWRDYQKTACHPQSSMSA